MNTSLIELLTAYIPLDATEQQHHADTLAFVTQTPDCTQRTTLQGYATASAWILSPDGDALVLQR